MDYGKDLNNILQESCRLACALSKVEQALEQFETGLGDFHSNLITKKTKLYEFVNERINDPNTFNKNTSQNRITQFDYWLSLYTPGQGFVDFKKLPNYSLMDKTTLYENKYRKYLTKAESVVELFEHYFSFLFLNKAVQYESNSIIIETKSFSYHIPRQLIPLFCASIVSLFETKGGGPKGRGPVYNVAESFLYHSRVIISSVSFQDLMGKNKLDDPTCAELFFRWNALVFYKSYMIGSVLFREQFDIPDRIPAENYFTNFCHSLGKYLYHELMESDGYIQVLLGRLKPLLVCSYNTLYFDLCLLLLADYLKYVLDISPSGLSSGQRRALCSERFKSSFEFFATQVLIDTRNSYTQAMDHYSRTAVPQLGKLLAELQSTEQIVLRSALYNPKRLPLLQMFSYYKTGSLAIPTDI